MNHQVIPSFFPPSNQCIYTKCYWYGEENVWMLCNYIKKNNITLLCDFYVIFISNENKTIPLWHQKSSIKPEGLVIWDYHVILLHHNVKNCDSSLYDLDTSLSFPCHIKEYFEHAIRSDERILPQFHRKFRVIPAKDYLKHFASDRSHMLGEDGKWQAQPPTYQPIKTSSNTMNLFEYISMEERSKSEMGKVYAMNEFILKFGMSFT